MKLTHKDCGLAVKHDRGPTDVVAIRMRGCGLCLFWEKGAARWPRIIVALIVLLLIILSRIILSRSGYRGPAVEVRPEPEGKAVSASEYSALRRGILILKTSAFNPTVSITVYLRESRSKGVSAIRYRTSSIRLAGPSHSGRASSPSFHRWPTNRAQVHNPRGGHVEVHSA
jgi:hypothetical protein